MQIVPIRPQTYGSVDYRQRQSHPGSVILPKSLTRSAYSEKSIEAFLHLYVPRGDFRATNNEGKEFIDILPMLSIRDEALQMAVLAIGTAALGKATGDIAVSQQGRTFYGKALKETAVALRNPTRAKSEAVFAVPRVMALFEILFGAEANTGTQAKSWLSHAEGETAMILSRGPEVYSQNNEAHLLFVNARYRPLIAAVRTRKATVLDEERWKTLPWKGRAKTPNDTLLDILCGVPEMLEAVDRLNCSTVDERQKEGLRIQTIAKCWTLHLELQTWLAANPTVFYTPTMIDSMAPIAFPKLEIACLTIRYWVTAMLLYSSLDIASGIQPSTDTYISHPDRPHPRKFARLICRSVSYFFRKEYGVTGATAISFPLGNALFYMQRNPGVDKEYRDMVIQGWSDTMLPGAIRDFLVSMKQSDKVPTLEAGHGDEAESGAAMPTRNAQAAPKRRIDFEVNYDKV